MEEAADAEVKEAIIALAAAEPPPVDAAPDADPDDLVAFKAAKVEPCFSLENKRLLRLPPSPDC